VCQAVIGSGASSTVVTGSRISASIRCAVGCEVAVIETPLGEGPPLALPLLG
jgi:hypothetical protein